MLGSASRKMRSLECSLTAIAYARESGDGQTLADALSSHAWANLTLSRPADAESALADAERIAGASTRLRLELLRERAFLSFLQQDVEAAVNIWERLRKEHRSLGNAHAEQRTVLNLAEGEHGRGGTPRAISLVREILARRSAGMAERIRTNLQSNLAGYLVADGDLLGAAEAAREVISLCAESDPGQAQASITIEHLALVLALRGDLARAATLEGYAAAAFLRYGFERESTERKTFARLSSILHEQLAPDELVRLSAEGSTLNPEAAAALALELDS
jgi:hypothetical protein